ncbi:MAG: 2-phospho-L-lactate transferase CofD family protein [Blastocatellales bacterium]
MAVSEPILSMLNISGQPNDSLPGSDRKSVVKVVLFSGGRGSRVLSRRLVNHQQVKLTLAVNGYDDGASTGEVRRFLGDSLGPSDFRKNASRMAAELQTCQPELIELLDVRLPVDCTAAEGLATLRLLSARRTEPSTDWQSELAVRLEKLNEAEKSGLAGRLVGFERELLRSGNEFSFSDCSLGNIVFAGCFLEVGRDFNAAITDYCALLNLPEGLIENVTTGENACLVALNREHRLLTTEAEIVSSKRRNHIQDIYLFDRVPTAEEEKWLESATIQQIDKFIGQRSITPAMNPRLQTKIAEADLIIYAPGTQHSSLFPSYLTAGLGEAIAQNLTAIKLLITNLQEDAEIPDSSAVDIIERAVYYLKDRNTRSLPTPCLITHYLLNDHEQGTDEKPYVPLGRLETLEDPRLVRIGNYEEGSSGCHDASKVLLPFIETALRAGEKQRVAVWLLDGQTHNKITQTILEALRGGLGHLPLTISVFYWNSESLPYGFTSSLPFAVRNVAVKSESETEAFRRTLEGEHFDYVILFDSSGMYQGEDIVNIASLLTNRRLDAVWGSRRLSVKDIYESYKLRYRHNLVLGAVSYLGSHLLSLAYLLRYGRYLSDTLSAARAIRAAYLQCAQFDLNHPCFNQQLLSFLLANSAELIETPVKFFPLSPEKVRRTSISDGLRSLVRAFSGKPAAWRAESSAVESGLVWAEQSVAPSTERTATSRPILK